MVDMSEEEVKKQTFECCKLIQELFLVNKISIAVGCNAMFSLIATISMEKKESFEKFKDRIFDGIITAENLWNTNDTTT